MIPAALPKFLEYECADDLIRVGKANDGGYLVRESDVSEADFLVSLGVFDDWSFEADFVKINDVPVCAYDGSVGGGFFLLQAIDKLMRGAEPRKIKRAWKKYFSFKAFFRGSRRHVEKFVGRESSEGRISMREVFAGVAADRIFLNIDIEGGEYEILDEIVKNKDRLTGLVMEFHDCPQHLDEIHSFVKEIGLPIVHIHANNYAPVDKSGLPFVLEISFSKRPWPSCRAGSYPHRLDMPNNPMGDEIQLSFVA